MKINSTVINNMKYECAVIKQEIAKFRNDDLRKTKREHISLKRYESRYRAFAKTNKRSLRETPNQLFYFRIKLSKFGYITSRNQI